MQNSKKRKFHQLFAIITFASLVKKGYSAPNLPPFFREDLNNHVIGENSPIGSSVFTLVGVDPEGSRVRYGIMGTDKLSVDEESGVVRIAKEIDREAEDQLKVSAVVEDLDGGNVVVVKNVVQIADVNDNPPTFLNQSTYESIEVIEDSKIGTRVLEIILKDPDLTGLQLSLNCTPTPQSLEACEVFGIEVRDATSGHLRADLKLKQKLDYNKRSLYQFILTASDGEHVSSGPVLIRVKDVQNTAPVFMGAMSGRIMEDAPVGSLVMIVEARDGDLGNPRSVRLSLLSNPGDCFMLDSRSGHLTTTRPLDRETLGSLLYIGVRAEEILKDNEVEGANLNVEDVLQTVANISVLIDDVNDFAPQFNQKEFWTELTENTPIGTPLSDLDIFVSDEDSGTFADFSLRIDGPLSELFDIEPKIVSGSARPVIRVKKSFDYENPNERKFLILIIAQNMEEPELFSTCTVSVSTIDENDNRPQFVQNVYTLTVPESARPGTKIGQITATDPDSKEFGNEGIIYQLVGSGNKKFSVNPKTGEISVADCPNSPNNFTVTVASCLDYEAQKKYDLLYMASDSYKMDGFIHSIVPLQIQLLDSNDNPLFFDTKFSRTLLENSLHFEPRFYIKAQDIDSSSLLSYQIVNDSPGAVLASKYFSIDPNSGEMSIRGPVLPPLNYSFNVEATDGVYSASAPVNIVVLDTNNNAPTFGSFPRDIKIGEDAEIGTLLVKLNGSDADFGANAELEFNIEKGSWGDFGIDKSSGEIRLINELDDEKRGKYELFVSVRDLGTPSLRTFTTLSIVVRNVYDKLPKIVPEVQRFQISESAKIGDLVGKIQLDREVSSEMRLDFEIVEPMEARNLDNKAVPDYDVFKDWFTISHSGSIFVSAPLSRSLLTSLNLSLVLTSPSARPSSSSPPPATLLLTLFSVNTLGPRIEDVEIETYEELGSGLSLLTLSCEDPEGGGVSYGIEEGGEVVSVDNKTGELRVRGRLDYEESPMYNLTVVCVDGGVPERRATGTVMISLLNINDNAPEFNQSVYSAQIDEHSPEGTPVTSLYATDLDSDVIFYEIEPSAYSAAFKIDRLGHLTVSSEGAKMLDFEKMSSPFISLGVRGRDSEHSSFCIVEIEIRDINDVRVKMRERSLSAVLYAPLHAMQEIMRVGAEGGDGGGVDELRYRIESGNEEGVFEIGEENGILRVARAFEEAKEFRLVIQVNDSREGDAGYLTHFDRAGVFIQVLPGNFRKPEFKFPNRVNSTLPALESNSGEILKFTTGNYSKVLGQVSAVDLDEGEAGRIDYYFKDGENLVTELEEFSIETETGRILQIKPLDREDMNHYNLLVVAKDNGKPVSSESHEMLNIVVEDIDDNKPKFTQQARFFNFSIKENSLENTFIGQVLAKDEDEGRNAQIFYFLSATEENHHYLHNDLRVDIKSGSIYTNAVLDHERMNSYDFFIRASSSPMLNKSAEVMKMSDVKNDPSIAVVHLKIIDLNDNSPRFLFREYSAGISSNSEGGRQILSLSASDPDPSSSSSLSYSLLASHLVMESWEQGGGAVIPSPFRVDERSGRVYLGPNGLRRYGGGGSRFLVRVGVREKVGPYYGDETQVKIWVVEETQEAILTIKTAPDEMLREELRELIGNITGNLILVNKVTPHVGEGRVVNKNWSDVYITAVDPKTSSILPVSQFLQSLDLGHDRLRQSGLPIELFSAVPAMSSGGSSFFNERESFDAAFAGLVALVALICMGVATTLALCCCLNRMYASRSEKGGSQLSSNMKYPLHPNGSGLGTPALSRSILKPQPEMIEDVATDNPLWTEHKTKTYEEQELTMQVASDLDNSNSTEDGMSVDEDRIPSQYHHNLHSNPHANLHSNSHPQASPQFSHAYATLHPHPAEYDNLTLIPDDTSAVHL